ncbi:conserved hypothetical protein [Histoplasma capsulatum G186AR]|uniref:Uncharacterized protein n=1 Tax=Ajellomyces capsulatus (strain G186AR / H82 / ATCC MYA-2454 / RMSCC 2432) TaxID=447093 RepID=C0NJ08_AJECG|nr:uncharacterized protein HCBG_03138 [Histoplasma capsulatum G186AR]EEH07849.1 conserved hypothetical protein [Histoplasma capsulatum G186AR]
MEHMFIPPAEMKKQCLIQMLELAFWQMRVMSNNHLKLDALTDWLYAMRRSPSTPPNPKNEDKLLAKRNRAKAYECGYAVDVQAQTRQSVSLPHSCARRCGVGDRHRHHILGPLLH